MKAPIILFRNMFLALFIALNTMPAQQFVQASELSQDSSFVSSAPVQRAATESKSGYSNGQLVHLLNRISFGPHPSDIRLVKQMGVNAFIEQQLHPQSIIIPDNLRQLAQVPSVSESPAYLFQTYGRPALKAIAQQTGDNSPEAKQALQKIVSQTYQKLYEDTATAHIARAVYSPAQLQELMTDFWYNHFNISIDKSLDHLWVGAYEESAIRPYVLGRFRDLLGATAHHAAMLFYLDNWENTAPGAQVANQRFKGINENYARELMELHTLGVDGGYTQKDVQELARILTGLGLQPGLGFAKQGLRNQQAGGFSQASGAGRQRLAGQRFAGQRFAGQRFGGQRFGDKQMLAAGGVWQSSSGKGQMLETAQANVNNKFGSYFDARRHDFGDKQVLGYRIKGTGENEIEEVLDILARHPATAHHIAYKLAQYFVSDKPASTLVDKLSKRFLDSDGDIAAVLQTLFHSPEFWDEKAVNAKFKSPYRYMISSLRATDADLGPIKPILGTLNQLGMPLYKCLTPDGYKNTKEAWLNPDNLLNRINFATALGTGHYKGASVRVQNPADLADCIGPTLSDQTIDAVMKSPETMRISLVLGSPEFMKY